MQITAALLKKLAPTAKKDRIEAIVAAAPTVLPKYGITTPNRLQPFFANLSHESGDFNIGRENVNYSAANLGKIWDSGNWRGYFPKRSDLLKYAGRGQALLNIVYGNRMGNGPASSGDGYCYRGGGLPQITGRDGYLSMQKITGFPLVANPDMVFDADKMLEVACAFWRWKKLEPLADRGDFDGICMKWNGARTAKSVIGMADRRRRLKIAESIFTENLDPPIARTFFDPPADAASAIVDDFVDDDLDATAPPASDAVDPRWPDGFEPLPGSKGDARVFFVQSHLKGFNISPGDIDGKWGGATSAALARYINDRDLESVNAPTSYVEFNAGFPLIYGDILQAHASGWVVEVSDARKEARPEILEKLAPEQAPAKRSGLAAVWASVVAFVGGIANSVKDQILGAWNYVTGYKDTGIGNFISEKVHAVPTTVWFIAGAGLLLYIGLNALRSASISTEAVKTGERT